MFKMLNKLVEWLSYFVTVVKIVVRCTDQTSSNDILSSVALFLL